MVSTKIISRAAKSAILLLLAMAATAGNAQTQRNAYFLERYAYRWQLNPALLPDWGFLAITPLAHWGFDVQTNFGVSDFLYYNSKDNNLYTFMDKDAITATDFSNAMPHTLNLRANVHLNLASFGFFAWGGYNVFGLDFTNNARIEIPKDFLMIPKKNLGDKYDLSGLGIRNEAYVTLSLGHARRLSFIDSALTVGATLKVLLGGASIKAQLIDSYLDLRSNLGYKLNYELMAASAVKLNFPPNGSTSQTGDLMGNLTENIGFNGLGGWGLGIDLGAAYQLLPELTLSAAITDLAFIRWNDMFYGQTKAAEYEFKGFEHLGGESFKADDYLPSKEQTDALSTLYVEGNKSRTTALNANLRIGGEYVVYRHRDKDGNERNFISFGLLSTTRFSGWGTMTELMATANLKPKWFNFVLNAAISNWGPTWGLYLGWAPRYFVNFFMSIDYVPYKFMGMFGLPANNASVSVNMGASIPLNWNPERKPKTGTHNKGFEISSDPLSGGGNALEVQQQMRRKAAGEKVKPVSIRGVESDSPKPSKLRKLKRPIVDTD